MACHLPFGGYVPEGLLVHPGNTALYNCLPAAGTLSQGTGMPVAATAAQWRTVGPAEVLLDCVYSAAVDVMQLPPHQRSGKLIADDGVWMIGRAHQPELFAALVPDESRRNLISRGHCSLSWEASLEQAALYIQMLSPNTLLLNGVFVPVGQPMSVAPGDHISLGGPLGEAPLLTFRIFFQEHDPGFAHQVPQLQTLPFAAAQLQPPLVHSAGFYHLTCVAACGRDLVNVATEMKTICVPEGATLKVGRQHQIGFFENILGTDSPYLTCMSRTHIELMPIDTLIGEPHSFRVTNFSCNPVVTKVRHLSKGEQVVVQLPTMLEFWGTSYAGEVPVRFLSLCFALPAGVQPSWSGRGPEAPPLQVQAMAGVGMPGLDVGRAVQPQSWVQATTPPQAMPAAPPAPRACELPCALLCVHAHGCDVASLAREAKRIALPVGEKALVGRQEQPGFFEGLLGTNIEHLRFVSRTHFVLEPLGQPGAFVLTNLSGNALLINDRRVGQGEQAALGPSSAIDFIVEQPPPAVAPPVVFLRLLLEMGAMEVPRAPPEAALLGWGGS